MSGEDADLILIFVYSAEDNRNLPLRFKLEQERAQRGISQNDWLLNVFCFNRTGQHLDRWDPWAGDFPVTVKMRFSGISGPPAGPEGSALDSNLASGTFTSTSLHAQCSNPVAICIYVLRVGRAPIDFYNALIACTDLNTVLRVLANGTKLICHPESRNRIEEFLRTRGYRVHGNLVYLDQMKRWHVIVENEFRGIVDKIVSNIPSRLRVTRLWSSLIEIPWLDGSVDRMEDPSSSSVQRDGDNADRNQPLSSSNSSLFAASSGNNGTVRLPANDTITCNVCGARFTSVDYLSRHMDFYHNDDSIVGTMPMPSSSSSSAAFSGAEMSSAHSGHDASVNLQETLSSLGVAVGLETSSSEQASENQDLYSQDADAHKRLKIAAEREIADTDIDTDDEDNNTAITTLGDQANQDVIEIDDTNDQDDDAAELIHGDQSSQNTVPISCTDDGNNDLVVSPQGEQTSPTNAQITSVPHECINNVETMNIVVTNTFVNIPPTSNSEGRQTVSTNEGGRARRWRMPPLPKTGAPPASVPPSPSEVWPPTPSLSTQSSSSQSQSQAQSQSSMGGVSFQRRCRISEEET